MSISATTPFTFKSPDGEVIERGLTTSNVINPIPNGTGVVLPETDLTVQYGSIIPPADINTPVLLQTSTRAHGKTTINNSITSTNGTLDLSTITNGVLNTPSLITNNLSGLVLGNPPTSQYMENLNIPTVIVNTNFVPNLRLDSGYNYLGQNAYPPPVLPSYFQITTNYIIFDLANTDGNFPSWSAGDTIYAVVNFLFKNTVASGRTTFNVDFTISLPLDPFPLWTNVGSITTYGTLNLQRNVSAVVVGVCGTNLAPRRMRISSPTTGVGMNFITGGYYSLTCLNYKI
jgi:hypothetical protein